MIKYRVDKNFKVDNDFILFFTSYCCNKTSLYINLSQFYLDEERDELLRLASRINSLLAFSDKEIENAVKMSYGESGCGQLMPSLKNFVIEATESYFDTMRRLEKVRNPLDIIVEEY